MPGIEPTVAPMLSTRLSGHLPFIEIPPCSNDSNNFALTFFAKILRLSKNLQGLYCKTTTKKRKKTSISLFHEMEPEVFGNEMCLLFVEIR